LNDDADVATLYASMRLPELMTLRAAFFLDLKAARNDDTRAFCGRRITLIDAEVERRGGASRAPE